MSEDKQPVPPSQSLTAGDASSNYQAGNNMYVTNNPPALKPSSILTPTNSQIAKFDPKLRRILEEAKYIELKTMNSRLSASRPSLVAVLAVLASIGVVLCGVGWAVWALMHFVLH